jgi:GNAT superfamily N-acetyltransferase
MQKSDLPQIIPLATQLGYPSNLAQLTERFGPLSSDEKNILLVAENEDGEIVAFAHAHETATLMTGRRAELNAIVVDESSRGAGIGKSLMAGAEKWVRSRGLDKLRLGTRSSRTDTHEFYKKIGFSIDKEWLVFSKKVEKSECAL